MRLDFCIVAEAAHATGGKLYIHGGALSNIAPPALPWLQPQLAFVLRVELEEGEDHEDHEIRLVMCAPSGEQVVPTLGVPLLAEHVPPRTPGRPIFLNMALTVGSIPIHEHGDYRLEVRVDDELVHVEPFFVNPPAG